MKVSKVAPDALDGEIAAEHAAPGTEHVDRRGGHEPDELLVHAVHERPYPRELDHYIGQGREQAQAGTPRQNVALLGAFEHPGVDKHEGRTREVLDQPGGVGHLGREHLQFEQPAQVGEQADVVPEDGVVHARRPRRVTETLVLVPVQLEPRAPHERRNSFLLAEHFAGAGAEQVGRANDGLGPTGGVVHALHPADLVHDPVERPVGLDVNGGLDAFSGNVPHVLVDEVVAPYGLVRPENPWHHRPLEPGHVGHAPDVVVTVDDVVHPELGRRERLCRPHLRPPSRIGRPVAAPIPMIWEGRQRQ